MTAAVQSGALQYPRHMLRKARVKEMLTRQVTAASLRHSPWATLVFTQRQACSFVLNQLVMRLPTFSKFLLSGACPCCGGSIVYPRSSLTFCVRQCQRSLPSPLFGAAACLEHAACCTPLRLHATSEAHLLSPAQRGTVVASAPTACHHSQFDDRFFIWCPKYLWSEVPGLLIDGWIIISQLPSALSEHCRYYSTCVRDVPDAFHSACNSTRRA
jgi:hypothetical protein